MKNTEIEKRFYANEVKKLLKQLDSLGAKTYEEHQIDTYFVPSHRNFLDEAFPFE